MSYFNKKNLEGGMIAETRHGDRVIFINRRFMWINKSEAMSNIDMFNADLLHRRDKSFDIMKIYKIIRAGSLEYIINNLPSEKVKLVWDREKIIDWDKVPAWTPVKVGIIEQNAYFLRISEDPEGFLSYIVTKCDKFTYNEKYEESYPGCNLHPSVEIEEEWYK